MKNEVTFRCSSCNARLKASIRLVGQARPCPACRAAVVLLPVAPEPAGPLLVMDDLARSSYQPGTSFRA